jgi:hypothetical protein
MKKENLSEVENSNRTTVNIGQNRKKTLETLHVFILPNNLAKTG